MKSFNEYLLNNILENSSEGIYILDENLNISFLNKRGKEIFGLEQDDNSMIGLHCHDFSGGRLCEYTGSLCEAMRSGRNFDNIDFEYHLKNGKSKKIRQKVRRVIGKEGETLGGVAFFSDITEHMFSLKTNTSSEPLFRNIVGRSYNMLEVFESIKQVAHKNVSVLILGETGTGKELVANALHAISDRKNEPFIKINCSALSENILESELFGHVKGSFTGAIRDKVGKFELANRGTIFLDEIGEISHNMQLKLLRVLQEKEIERVGGNRTVKVDVRVIAATNKILKDEVGKGNFREDLYFRLNVYPIKLPPLRERIDDIELLCSYFLEKLCIFHEKKILISERVINAFKRYSWPGNIRELEHAIEYGVIRSKGKEIGEHDLPEDLLVPILEVMSKEENNPLRFTDHPMESILNALQVNGWNKSKVAKQLKIGRTTLWRLMKKYKIEDPSKVNG